ncbi:hypothetical protein [Streptomyces jeddahensis]|uniref:Nucleopolyhedrovirus P10 family protein n=1 Tax=Streptomyces jeddahensis TaxID=1716141 RepID=A0A177HQU1_9ACTN|nr:hypothetical protein [Streptomyces jeddahensis]OAH13263.1 hypothetical protein STSP_34180 [Streptomyces jeddahensis]
MTADRWTQAVRRQLRLGRLLPLGGPRDGAWLAESAADRVLRAAAEAPPGNTGAGIRLGALRIAPADPYAHQEPAVPPPPSALPPGPLRITAEFAATPADPLQTTADRLRTTLFTTATEDIGLTVTEVDLRVTALLDTEETAAAPDEAAETGAETGAGKPGDVQRRPAGSPEETAAGAQAEGPPADEERRAEPGQPSGVAEGRTAEAAQTSGAGGDEARVAAAVLAVPGVVRLTGTLGGRGRAVHIDEHSQAASDAALPRRHVRVELAASRDHRTLDVAIAVRAAVTESLPGHPTVAVLVTELS